jgi:hypothetical protein
MGKAIGYEKTNALMHVLDRWHIDAVPSYLGKFDGRRDEESLKKRRYKDSALQFLHVYKMLGASRKDILEQHGEREVMEQLADLYGSFFNIMRTGKIATIDDIDPKNVEYGVPLAREALARLAHPEIIKDMTGLLLELYASREHEKLDHRVVKLPVPTSEHPDWSNWMLGYAARFQYAASGAEKEIGAAAFPYFLYVTTGVQADRFQAAAATILKEREAYHRGIATAVDEILLGKFGDKPVPSELRRMTQQHAVYEEAMGDGKIELEERALLSEYLRMQGIWHPQAVSLLTSPNKIPHPEDLVVRQAHPTQPLRKVLPLEAVLEYVSES